MWTGSRKMPTHMWACLFYALFFPSPMRMTGFIKFLLWDGCFTYKILFNLPVWCRLLFSSNRWENWGLARWRDLIMTEALGFKPTCQVLKGFVETLNGSSRVHSPCGVKGSALGMGQLPGVPPALTELPSASFRTSWEPPASGHQLPPLVPCIIACEILEVVRLQVTLCGPSALSHFMTSLLSWLLSCLLQAQLESLLVKESSLFQGCVLEKAPSVGMVAGKYIPRTREEARSLRLSRSQPLYDFPQHTIKDWKLWEMS